jgi:twitching motility protein PilT
MFLNDDHLFRHWIEEKVEMEDVLGKAHDPDSLAKRIATARRQIEEGLPVDYSGRGDETT